MEIRKLGPEDAAGYRTLRIEALTKDPDAFSASLEDALKAPLQKTESRLSDKAAVTFGAFEDGKLVGNVTLAMEMGTKTGHRASVYAVYVTPSARGKGIARRLMETLIGYAKRHREIEQLYLMVNSANVPAVKLYGHLGFLKYGVDLRAMKAEDRYIDEDLMVKFL
ncbi:N-acetyltransferase family protein [Planococcus sp. FY231025]|uniref:GNAT family N-acetyltransferase n=1 Tax=Planococcus sp. FY231025 TaxID=3455699 RepID=UPI003F8E758F